MAYVADILVVDDEADIRETIEDYFELQGFTVHSAADGGEMREVLARQDISLVILDVRMPGEDGFQLCRHLRENHDLGVIMLTGSADTVDRIVGLEIGADDYVAKPFDLRELLARVKSVQRRLGERGEKPQKPAEADEIVIGLCRLNPKSRTLRDKDGAVVGLSGMEFDLLKAFADHPNHVLTRDQLLDIAHKKDWDPYDRSIDVRVTRLRKKVEPDPAKPRYIKTVRGVGYMYSPEGE